MKGHKNQWSEEEKQFIFAHYKEWPKPELCRRMNAELGTNKTKENLKGFYSIHKLTSGIVTTFQKGRTPENKGKPMAPEVYEKCKATMFKKGNTPHNALAVGSKILHKDKRGCNYWYTKTAEPDVWEPTHRLLWKEHNGEIPPGHCIIFLDGNSNNITIENLRMVSLSDNAFINHLFGGMDFTAEEKNVIVDIAQVRSRIYQRMKDVDR